MKKSGIGSSRRGRRTAGANNGRTGHSLARLVNFISHGGQALNFGTSIIALRFVLQPFPLTLCSFEARATLDARRAASHRVLTRAYTLRQFDGFHFGWRATTIVSFPWTYGPFEGATSLNFSPVENATLARLIRAMSRHARLATLFRVV